MLCFWLAGFGQCDLVVTIIYIATNRNLTKTKSRPFGGGFNDKGPNELRFAHAERGNDEKWKVSVLADKQKVDGVDGKVYASEACFLELQKTMREQKRDCVFFVHGYNNNFEDALDAAERIQKKYSVEVFLFSWPANGGGGSRLKDVHGLVSYKWDKRDASASIGAIDRVFELFGDYLIRHRKVTQRCNQSINLLVHSMGCFLLKKLLGSGIYSGETLLFDNVVLAAADVNNAGHVEWVNRIAHRKNIYIAINENDFALKASRFKMGDRQRARLGHYTRNLTSDVASYLDFTKTPTVGKSHGYFAEEDVSSNEVYEAFNVMLHGGKVEQFLEYNPHTNAYEV